MRKDRLSAGAVAVAMAVALPAFLIPTTAQAAPTEPRVTDAVRHDTSPRLRDMVRPLTAAQKAGPPREVPIQLPVEALERAKLRAQPLTTDPLRQFTLGEAAAPDPTVNFEGQSDDDNAAILGFRIVPPDTEGDVGPNHYMQWINLIVEIYDKSGNSVLGPFAGNDFFAGFGGPCETNNDGDPVVLYDQLADRWMVSQFSINEGVQCVAVSTSGDPTGSYHRYAFTVSPGANDYPKMGLWPDGYYMTFNEFNPSFTQAVACALEREEMLAGNAAQQVCFGVPAQGGDTFFSLQPAHLEGSNPPPTGAPNPFIMAFDDETWGGGPDGSQDFYKIWHFAVDWANPGSSTFAGPIDVATAEFDAEFCNFSRNCIPQPGTSAGLDVLGQFTMFRAAYRNFGAEHPDGAHQELWVNHTVDLDGSSHAGIRWTELRDPAGTPTLHQSGTLGPADNENRWMGSLSVDDEGNMLLAYSVSSESVFPSIRYAGRLVSDPPGQLGQSENELWAGTGSQTGSSNRWGDYSTVSLDESDGCSLWMTNEYYETTTSFDFKTRVGAVDLCAGGGNQAPQVTILEPADGSTFTEGDAVTFSGTAIDAEDGDISADLVWTSSLDGQIGTGAGFTTSTLSTGTHTITASATDSDGGTGSDSIGITIQPVGGEITLSVTVYKERGLHKADLTWSGATSTMVDIYRDGALITTTANDGFHKDNIDNRGGQASYTYQVCEAGTSTCSDPVTGTL